MQELVWAEINLEALKHNASVCQQAAPGAKMMAIIKANAYGHGAIESALALPEADYFAVARLNEASALRHAGIQQRLLVLSGIMQQADIISCIQQNIEIVVHNLEFQRQIEQIKLPHTAHVWLKIDTGMHRLGLNEEDLLRTQAFIQQRADIECRGFLSHLASSDELDNHSNQQQQRSFQEICSHQNIALSLANSAAVLFHPHCHEQYIRPGIALYGANPSTSSNVFSEKLIPVMTLKARILNIRTIKKGESVGYNASWTAQQESRIATIAIGYADGYPRHAKNGTPVLINGQRYPLAGRVSMDLITVDISTDNKQTRIADEVTLWGEGLAAEEIAASADTISYQLFTAVSERVKRIYSPASC